MMVDMQLKTTGFLLSVNILHCGLFLTCGSMQGFETDMIKNYLF